MTQGNSSSDTPRPAETSAARSSPPISSLPELSTWIDQQLELLMLENQAWQTVGTVRQYFAR